MSLLLPVSLFVSSALAEESLFEGRYESREGTVTLGVALDVEVPRGGAARVDRDGEGLRIAAEGAGNSFAFHLGITEGSFEPDRECVPSREGCSFELAVLDSRGNRTGTVAEVFVQSTTGEIDPKLVTESVRMQTGDGLSVGVLVSARPEWNDIDVFLRMDHDGILIDFDDEDKDDDPPKPPPPSDLETYKVLTYNVAGLPQTAFSDDNFGPDDDYEERAHDISAYVIANDYDIIVFNEVFEDTMRETLIADLEGDYPYIIKEAWDGDSDSTHRQDSGLMLFSRFGGDPMDIGEECNASSEVDLKNFDDGGGTSICDAAFWPFTDLDGEDSWSEKGFIWAHLWNPRTGRPISIIGTHTQATYYAVDTELFNDEREARLSNFKEIFEVIDQVSHYGEDLIFMGDMNVIGDYDGKNSEYMEIFGPSGMIRDHDLGDMWRDTSSLDDPGYSWDGSDGPLGNMVANDDAETRERLDYMVALDPAVTDPKFEEPCFQHMQLRRDFKGAYGDLSDHYGLDAVIGWDSDRCSPMRALEDVTGGVGGTIEYRGAYQWYRYNEPGTYSLQVYSPDLDIEVTVYDATDLSTPLGYFEGDGEFQAHDRETISVLAPTGPFYLRVRAKDPLETGNYSLTLEPNDGSSWTNYLVLLQNETVNGSYGEMINAPAQDHVYYKFKQKALWSTNNGNQEHTFVMNGCDQLGPCTSATFSLWDASQQHIYTSASTTAWLTESSESWLPNVADYFYVTVDRSNENTQRAVSMMWMTDLKEVYLADLTCHEQEDLTGDDDIYADIYVDGTSPSGSLIDLDYGQMDTNGNNEFPIVAGSLDTTRIAFKSTIVVDLYEVDDNPDDDDYLGTDTLYNGGAGFEAYTNSVIADPELNAKADPDALKFDLDDAAYSLNWWTIVD